MMYAEYLRIEKRTIGVSATPREFVKACHSMISKKAKGRAMRTLRHAWIREGLEYLLKAREEYLSVVLGRPLYTVELGSHDYRWDQAEYECTKCGALMDGSECPS